MECRRIGWDTSDDEAAYVGVIAVCQRPFGAVILRTPLHFLLVFSRRLEVVPGCADKHLGRKNGEKRPPSALTEGS